MFEIAAVQKYVNLVDLDKMLSNACFLAKFLFNIAENEPAKNLQNSAKKMLILLTLTLLGHGNRQPTDQQRPKKRQAQGLRTLFPFVNS